MELSYSAEDIKVLLDEGCYKCKNAENYRLSDGSVYQIGCRVGVFSGVIHPFQIFQTDIEVFNFKALEECNKFSPKIGTILVDFDG